MNKLYFLIAHIFIQQLFAVSDFLTDYKASQREFKEIKDSCPGLEISAAKKNIEIACSEKKWLKAAYMTILSAAHLKWQKAVTTCANAAPELGGESGCVLCIVLTRERENNEPDKNFFSLVKKIASYYKNENNLCELSMVIESSGSEQSYVNESDEEYQEENIYDSDAIELYFIVVEKKRNYLTIKLELRNMFRKTKSVNLIIPEQNKELLLEELLHLCDLNKIQALHSVNRAFNNLAN